MSAVTFLIEIKNENKKQLLKTFVIVDIKESEHKIDFYKSS